MAIKHKPGAQVILRSDKDATKPRVYIVDSVGPQGRGFTHTLKGVPGTHGGAELLPAPKK